MIMITTYIGVQIIFLLRDPAFFNVKSEEIGRVTNEIIFYSLIAQLVISIISGYLFDMAGRKITIFLSLLSTAIVMALLPYSAPEILLLILCRVGITTFSAPL
jgi:MFS family permease